VKVLIGVVCNGPTVSADTVPTIAVACVQLATSGHTPALHIQRAMGRPDVARSLLATQAIAGRYDVLMLVEDGAALVGSPLELCEGAAEIARGDGFDGVTAYSVRWLQNRADELPKVSQGWWPFFLPCVRDGKYLDGYAALHGSEKVAIIAGCRCACPAIEREQPASKLAPPSVHQVQYPSPTHPVGDYLAALEQTATKVRPTAGRSLTEPPPMPAMPSRRLDRQIKVALVNTCMLAGGAERQTCTLACHLPRDRYDVTVVNAQPEMGTHRPLLEMLARADIPSVEGSSHPAIDEADAVLWWGPALVGRLKGGRRVRGSIHVAHSDSHWTAEAIVACRDRIDRVVAVSGPAARMVEGVLGLGAGSVPVIWNGIDPGEFAVPPPSRLGDPFTVGYLGRLSAEKNPAAIVAAVAKLAHVRLKIWGAGPMEVYLREVVDELGVSQRVDFCGVAEDRAAAYAQMDCLVLASLFEGLPLTVIEAMFAGVPVLAPEWGDLPLVLGSPRAGCMEGRRGWLIDPNPQSIAETLEVLIERQARGDFLIYNPAAKAREFAGEHFTASRMARAYAAIIEGVACQS
jgi:glycosyltransferase involved in cell wall biosynthesis